DYASHSGVVAQLRERLLDELSPIRPRASDVPFYSTVTGQPLGTAQLDAGYWYRSLRQRVEFLAATAALLDHGHRIFIEVSPRPVLTVGVLETADEAAVTDAVAIGTLRREDGGAPRICAALAEAHVHGVPVDWPAVFGGPHKRVPLPTYPFNRERYWRTVP